MEIILDEVEASVFTALIEAEYNFQDVIALIAKNNLVTVTDTEGNTLFEETEEEEIELIDLEGFNELGIEKEQTENQENETKV